MILSASALRQAFLTHVSGELGSDFDQAFARHCPGSPEEISLPHAALILSDAVLGNPPFGIGETRLTSVALMVGGQTVLLDPPAAAIHPMLRDWAAPTIAEALRQPLMAGALMLDCVAGSPEFADVEITVRGSAGETVGFAHLRFPNAYALLCYGAVHPQDGLVSSRRISGARLRAVGAACPVSIGETATAEPADEGEPGDLSPPLDSLPAVDGAATVMVH